ncbi:MAG TPA: efflux RND transporter permease subunit, partial [Gammaproteobacteria bacterium]|nr:efflux RND transporter permease subunit [Gammaproteobacteria bacterium]
DALVSRPRPVLLVLAMLLIAGAAAYLTIPKEAEPDIPIPQIYVNVVHEGISPEDAERLLIRPMETELRTIEGLKEMRATGSEGVAVLNLEFEAGFDADQALLDVREKVDIAKAELPQDAEEPYVQEVSIALFPVLVVLLHGDIPERALVRIARELRDAIEGLPGVLQAEIGGDREELLEVIVDPVKLESYNLDYQDIFNYVSSNNRLVAAGALDNGSGRFAIKVPGVLETLEDLMGLPIKSVDGTTITFGDVAEVRRTFKDPQSYARLNGNRTVALEISKRVGANIIQVVDSIRALVDQAQEQFPETLEVEITQDNSEQVRTLLQDLQNNVLTAVLLVMIVVLASLGLRSATLVAVAIPGSFLAAILTLGLIGYSINMVVLFSLIMAVGMLVDGSIVVVELAERNMAEGHPTGRAYVLAAQRMAWPITASTATTLAAFMPLVFWPGMIGEFMKYLPITLLITLSASLAMALIFVPTIGSLLRSRKDSQGAGQVESADSIETLNALTGITARYVAVLRRVMRHPGIVVAVELGLLEATFIGYNQFGRGVQFMPDVEPEQAILNIHARGDLSIEERDALVAQVEERILDMPEYSSVYTRSAVSFGGNSDEDIIGRIQLNLVDWFERRRADAIMNEVRARTADMPGIIVEPQVQESGLTSGKSILLELSSNNGALLSPAIARVRARMEQTEGIIDITDNRPVPGIDWRIIVDREQAARFGADVSTVGNAIQLVTNGIMVGDYRPDDADDEVDIRVRFPDNDRFLGQLDRLRINVAGSQVPVANFITREPAQRVGNVERTDGVRVMRISADVHEDVLASDKVQELQAWLSTAPLDPRVDVAFKGEDQDQREAEQFLSRAFGAALFLMAIILVAQFNSFYQAALILTAVVFSIVGVLLGLLITDQPFGVVMCGIGVIALAGIVVNNNIVLIDTFNRIRPKVDTAANAALLTCAQRLRPVMLTTITTILGLLPMVLGINVNLVSRDIQVGGPSTQWWTQLASTVAGGLAFATLLTLLLTPCLLVVGERFGRFLRQRRHKLVSEHQPARS